MTAWRIPDECLMNAWWMPDECLTAAWRMPDDCLMSAWRLPDVCLTTSWRLPDDCLTTVITNLQMNLLYSIQNYNNKTNKIWYLQRLPIRTLQPENIIYLNLCLLVPCWCHCQFMQIKLVNHWIIGQFLHILCCHNNCDGYWNRSRPSLNLANIF